MATGSALRAGVMRRRGASTRIAAGWSKNPKAGRAAYATRRIPKCGFIALYAGDWEYLEEPRPYRGTNKYVVDCNFWRIKPRICKKLGKVSAAKYIAAMINEPAPGVRARHTRVPGAHAAQARRLRGGCATARNSPAPSCQYRTHPAYYRSAPTVTSSAGARWATS